MVMAPPFGRRRSRNPLAHERMRSRSHRECGGVLRRRRRRADDGGKRAGGVSGPLCHPREAAPDPFPTGVAHALPCPDEGDRAACSCEVSIFPENERLLVFVVSSDLAESESAARDVQVRAESIADPMTQDPLMNAAVNSLVCNLVRTESSSR
jgi:hypothetical protein